MKLPNGLQTPALWQMIQWIARPLSYMDNCAQQYGDIFTVPMGKNFARVIFVSNPQALQQILTSDAKEFDTPGEHNAIFEPLLGKQS
ncbi:MAG TPA: cytochrome P450, partial [Cyanobacteria bacterium UBA12227]|nr:cytochrome P450 [Cyanobacteria bacterium UBA12227]